MGHAEPGLVLAARYRLRSVIRRDETGAVWLANDGLRRTDVVVRAIPWAPHAGDQQARRERVFREARALAQSGHPNIAGVLDIVEDGGRPWLVLAAAPYRFPYRSLSDVVRADGPLRPEQAAFVGWQLAAALGAAHALGVPHRGVKPGSVLLGAGNRVALADFCLVTEDTAAAPVPPDGPAGPEAPAAREAPVPEPPPGAPFYLAPERVLGKPATPAADLWSLGATVYAAVEGRSPFYRDDTAAVISAVISDPPDPPRRAGPLWPVISGLLRKDDAARPDAAEAAWLLRRVARSHRPAPPVRPAARAPLLAGATASGSDTEDYQTGPLPAVTAAAAPRAHRPRTHPPDAGNVSSAADFIPGFGPRAEAPAAAVPHAAPRQVPLKARRSLPGQAWRSLPGKAWQSLPGKAWRSLPRGPRRSPPRGPWQPRWVAVGIGGSLAVILVAVVTALWPASGTASGPSLAVAVPRHGVWSPGPAPAASHRQGVPPAAQNASGARRVVPPGAAVPEPARPVSPAPRRAPARTVPAGFHRYHDRTGFSIGVPAHWQVSHQGHLVYIRDPRSGLFLIVDQTSHPRPSPLADWRQQEAARIASYPGYHRIRLRAVRYAQAERAADWQFTYDDNGQLTEVLNRNILVNAHRAYALYWSAPARAWHASYHYFRAFASTFRPAPGQG
jgi:eukaryotic-like serine/threonine-protein kinase